MVLEHFSKHLDKPKKELVLKDIISLTDEED